MAGSIAFLPNFQTRISLASSTEFSVQNMQTTRLCLSLRIEEFESVFRLCILFFVFRGIFRWRR